MKINIKQNGTKTAILQLRNPNLGRLGNIKKKAFN